MIKRLSCFLLLWCLCSFEICTATIIVDSVHVTPSTCPNNGTATIYAHSTSDSAVFLYNVVAGPVLYPQQNDSVFASLYPGTYTAWVHDINSFDSAKVTFTITGNYQTLAFNPAAIATFCPDGTDGEIIANPDKSTGLAPYSYQIISPDTGLPQSNDTFNNLAALNYVLKITDGCNISHVADIQVDSGGTGFSLGYYGPNLQFIACNTLLFSQEFYLDSDKAYLPLKVTYTSDSGTRMKYIHPEYLFATSPPKYRLYDTLYNIDYGDYLKICISDTCNVSVCYIQDTISPFTFILQYSSAVSNCTPGYQANVQIGGNNFNYNYPFIPSTWLTVVLKNIVTGAIADSFAFKSSLGNSPVIPPQADTNKFLLTVSDNCGHISKDTVQWPPVVAPYVYLQEYPASCLDSTGICYFNFYGLSSPVSLQLLSGPALSQSNKRGYSYRDTLTYPISFNNIIIEQYGLANMPAGVYSYRISDTCGNEINDSINLMPDQVISLGWRTKLKSSCNGQYTIDFVPNNQEQITPFSVQFYELITHQNLTLIAVGDTGVVRSQQVGAGTYIFECSYNDLVYSSLLPGNNLCWTYYDTIIIPAYNDSILKATDVAKCNGTIYIQAEVDSSKGILPFQYEILNGPEVFALQDSANFTVHTYGTYLIGVRDSCGNEDTRQLTIDTGRFDPVVKTGGWCAGSNVQLSDVVSPYFTYRWNKPDGSVFSGDTLNIYPFTSADTGVYYITKIVQINDCSDSAFGTYHLIFRDTFQQNFALCPGDTFHVGPYYHTEPGVYYDTLTGMDGCDSIEVTNFSFLPSVQAHIFPSSPVMCPIYPTMLIARGGTVYSWSPGGYQTDTVTLNPNIPTTYAVTVGAGGLCPDTASVLVYPVVDSLINISAAKTTFCYLDSALICGPNGFETYIWNDGETDRCIEAKQSGNYYLAVTDYKGCQINSNHLAIAVNPAPPVEITISGDTLRVFNVLSCQWYLNGSALANATDSICIAHQPGTYTVFITDSLGCSIMSNGQVITGLNQLQDNISLHIYPDPASDELNIAYALQQAAGVQITVTDLSGRLIQEVLNEKAAGGTYLKQVNIRHMAAGVYVLSFVSDGATALQRFVKE